MPLIYCKCSDLWRLSLKPFLCLGRTPFSYQRILATTHYEDFINLPFISWIRRITQLLQYYAGHWTASAEPHF